MRICPQCRTAYPNRGGATCSRDGTRLVDARDFAEAQADPLIGQTVGGRYQIIERVGVGGMGTVYRATQAGLERHVALKILKKELSWDRDTTTRFHREARAMSLLTHPNTVRVFDFGETNDGLLYFAMELLEGELLTSKLEREGALDVRDAIRVVQQILRSLSEAHSKGIIHRDLKPDNIYLAQVEGHPEPVVKVLDFGIAKVVQGDRMIDQLETQAGTVFGTPRYMSPEQAQGKKLDPRSDLYSVGILLYQLLTGRAPFVDDDAVVVMAKHIRERPDPIREAAPDRPIPTSLERVVLRAVEKEPARRFKSAERFATKLESCLPDVEAEIAGRLSPFGSLARTLHNVPRLPLLVAAGGLMLAVGVAGILVAASAGTEPMAQVDPADDTPRSIAAEPPGTSASAELTVRSVPSGAEVWWEGSKLGVTPLSVRRPQGSLMDVELRLDGYQRAAAELVADGSAHTIELTPTSDAVARADTEERSTAGESDETDEPTRAERRAAERRWARRRARARARAAAMRTEEPTEPEQPVRPAPTMATMADEPYERW